MAGNDLRAKDLADGELDRYLSAAVRAAHEAGHLIRAAFTDDAVAVRSKSPGDYVTEIDLAAEKAIRDRLCREVGTAAAFIGEECGGAAGVVDGLCWVVDPLDGTTNFVRGFPSVGVSIALVADGEPVVAAVHAPMWGETFTAVRGHGAARNGTPIRVAGRPAAQAVCATGFPFKMPDSFPLYLDVLTRIVRAVEDIRRPAGASLDLAWVACGVFDAFFELALGPWDVAAGALLVREAGGVVTDWHGDHNRWLTTGHVLAASPRIHPTLLAHTRTADLPGFVTSACAPTAVDVPTTIGDAVALVSAQMNSSINR
ncbi:inositol monophosphatase family protein [Actinokineospora iranica]|uniref:Inositol-1-monophosphatase n=1 Tax=Actinokineospora iranica TaxID=1271860 RepID=A0A1G6UA28_9PSEU|nr:inositol monophosphatase family protein [Actinokineospora iranica]SDD38131.1 myo-inositol-1(or 4)-monophosphatase [Actinokineospora iranica]